MYSFCGLGTLMLIQDIVNCQASEPRWRQEQPHGWHLRIFVPFLRTESYDTKQMYVTSPLGLDKSLTNLCFRLGKIDLYTKIIQDLNKGLNTIHNRAGIQPYDWGGQGSFGCHYRYFWSHKRCRAFTRQSCHRIRAILRLSLHDHFGKFADKRSVNILRSRHSISW